MSGLAAGSAARTLCDDRGRPYVPRLSTLYLSAPGAGTEAVLKRVVFRARARAPRDPERPAWARVRRVHSEDDRADAPMDAPTHRHKLGPTTVADRGLRVGLTRRPEKDRPAQIVMPNIGQRGRTHTRAAADLALQSEVVSSTKDAADTSLLSPRPMWARILPLGVQYSLAGLPDRALARSLRSPRHAGDLASGGPRPRAAYGRAGDGARRPARARGARSYSACTVGYLVTLPHHSTFDGC
jgi:hypothetical protein